MVGSTTARGTGKASRAGVRGAELRDLLERTLEALNEDDARGPSLRAIGLRLRLRVPDAGLVLDLAASESPERYLSWSFEGGGEWEPKVELEMDSELANAYLQGRESLAIAIARGRVRCRCESRAAVLFLPAVKLIADRYRRIVASEYPHLALDAPGGRNR